MVIQRELSVHCPSFSFLCSSIVGPAQIRFAEPAFPLWAICEFSPATSPKPPLFTFFSLVGAQPTSKSRDLLCWLTPAAHSIYQTTTWLAMNPVNLFTVPRHSPGSCDGKELTKSPLVLDLPQIYTKPSGTELMKALDLLAIKPRSFGTDAQEAVERPSVQPAGVTHYLTSIVASPLSWLDNDQLREAVWDAASARISERSGRTGRWSVSL